MFHKYNNLSAYDYTIQVLRALGASVKAAKVVAKKITCERVEPRGMKVYPAPSQVRSNPELVAKQLAWIQGKLVANGLSVETRGEGVHLHLLCYR